MATVFSAAMIQSLVPAFSQLLAPEKKNKFESLFSQSIRLNMIWLFPAVMFLFVVAKPFLTLWLSEEFGRESSTPLYILLIGLFFYTLASVPHGTITASGRTDLFAKLYWFELVIFIPVTIFFINSFGINGAALAWSLRTLFDAVVLIWLAKRINGVTFRFHNQFKTLTPAIITLLPSMLFVTFYGNFSLWLIPMVSVSLILYSLFTWRYFFDKDEKNWIKNKTYNLLGLVL